MRHTAVLTVALMLIGTACTGSEDDAVEDVDRTEISTPDAGPALLPPLVADDEGPVSVPVSGDTGTVHDPTVAREGDTYHLFFTHGGIQHRVSTDLQRWTTAPPVFEEPPEWLAAEAPLADGDIWAPDISQWGGRWHLYYSTSEFPPGSLPTRNSAIGHASAAALDATAEGGGWTDHGVVVRSRGQFLDEDRSGWNAIDPTVVLDDDGRPWLAWGSNYDGLFIQALNDDGTLDESISPTNIARRARAIDNLEAPTIVKRGDWWYLFASFDLCCDGMKATYNIRVGRSAALTGPYVDRDGRPMLDGGGTKVLTAYGDIRGPGHQTVFHEGSAWWLIHHWYDPVKDGQSDLGIRPLDWDDEGWPVARGWSPGIALPPPLGGHD